MFCLASQRLVTRLFSSRKLDTRLLFILEILDNPLPQMNGYAQLVSRVLEHHSMQLPSMAIKHRALLHARRRLLSDDVFARILVDLETVVAQVDAQRAHALRNLAVLPPVKDPAAIGPE